MILVYAFARLERRQWVIPHCPFCGQPHRHGAGGETDNPHDYLGSRVPHCCHHTADDYWLTVDARLHGTEVPRRLYSQWGIYPPEVVL